jgi:DNA-3-methyladenine glycosylase I
MKNSITRCGWVKLTDPIYVDYHDKEWGKPIYDDQALFELFSLETQSAGLSWLIILKKRDGYREVFEGFNLERIAQYSDKDIERIFESGVVVKSKQKIESIINNAKLFLEIQKEYGSLKNYFWGKINFQTIINDVPNLQSLNSYSDLSSDIAKELKKRGFKFIGSTTIYAFMQASGMINDHENQCHCK